MLDDPTKELGVEAALLGSCSAGETGSDEQLDCLVLLGKQKRSQMLEQQNIQTLINEMRLST